MTETAIIAQIASYIVPLLVLAALAVLLSKTGSPWLIAALASEVLSLLCRIALQFAADMLTTTAWFMSLWQLSGLIFGVCLLGFAVTWPARARER
ncbi:MAG: hypothetical protein JNN30_11950 [Rhodanobacteraceae bacterium]|nr:hypothetical protein [Rhodanobacteraceae bacterium]